MKSKILLTAFLLYSLLVAAQQKHNNVFAIVSNGPGKMSWMNIQEIDLSTGKVNRNIYEIARTGFNMVDGVTKKKLVFNTAAPARINAVVSDNPTATMVAAAAFDARHNKLFFTPLRVGELRWVNLDEKNDALNVYCLRDEAFTGGDLVNEARNITRMTVGSDGYGYALSNDGKKLIRFTTGKKTVVTNLGSLTDAPGNKQVSIHTRETSWGGDLIADASGNLYLISSFHAIFKINPSTLTAAFIGFIKGLPESYSTNGAAVDAAGNVVVSSAQSAEGYYKVDLTTGAAEKLPVASENMNSSDLASGNFAFTDKVVRAGDVIDRSAIISKSIAIYPNPLPAALDNFKVAFNNHVPGMYSVQLMDLGGRLLLERRVNISAVNQTENIPVNAGLARGMYLVKILNATGMKLSSSQILLQ